MRESSSTARFYSITGQLSPGIVAILELFLRLNRKTVMDIVTPEPDLGPLLRAIAVHGVTDPELENRLKRLAGYERKALTVLLAHLGEFDRRRLFADRGQPSMFQYCVSVLGYSEQAAYKRIQAARAAREHPHLLEHLWRGELHLAAIVVLAPHLRKENFRDLIAAARGKSKQELEIFVAGLAPKPDTPDLLRALPAATNDKASAVASTPPDPGRPSSPSAQPAVPQEVKPLAPARFLFRFTGSADLRSKYARLTKLMGIAPNGRMEDVFEAAVDSLLDRLDPECRAIRRAARRSKPSCQGHSDSRTVPRALRDEVWQRDSGRCTFMNSEGIRCPATSWLEIDHIRPYSLGGRSDNVENLRLLCRAHNQMMARRIFSHPRD